MVTVWLIGGKDRLRLPVLPEHISMPTENTIHRYEMQAIGEISLPGQRKLRALSISSYFPALADGNAAYTPLPKPSDAAAMIERWCYEHTVVTVLISGGAINLRMMALVEKFTQKIGKQAQDIEYELDLIEYRDLTARKAGTTKYNLPGASMTIEVPAPISAPKVDKPTPTTPPPPVVPVPTAPRTPNVVTPKAQAVVESKKIAEKEKKTKEKTPYKTTTATKKGTFTPTRLIEVYGATHTMN